jgi:hypothetical protein
MLGVPALALQFYRNVSLGRALAILGSEEGLRFSLGFLQFFLCRWCNLVSVIMVVVASSAAHFRSLTLY